MHAENKIRFAKEVRPIRDLLDYAWKGLHRLVLEEKTLPCSAPMQAVDDVHGRIQERMDGHWICVEEPKLHGRIDLPCSGVDLGNSNYVHTEGREA